METRYFLRGIFSGASPQVLVFDGMGRRTGVVEQQGIPYLINDFRTACRLRTYSPHETSHKICFKAQSPGAFINPVIWFRMSRMPLYGIGNNSDRSGTNGEQNVRQRHQPVVQILGTPSFLPDRTQSNWGAPDQSPLGWGGRWNGMIRLPSIIRKRCAGRSAPRMVGGTGAAGEGSA